MTRRQTDSVSDTELQATVQDHDGVLGFFSPGNCTRTRRSRAGRTEAPSASSVLPSLSQLLSYKAGFADFRQRQKAVRKGRTVPSSVLRPGCFNK